MISDKKILIFGYSNFDRQTSTTALTIKSFPWLNKSRNKNQVYAYEEEFSVVASGLGVCGVGQLDLGEVNAVVVGPQNVLEL